MVRFENVNMCISDAYGSCWAFDLRKAGATQTESSLLKQYVAGERVDLLGEHVYFLFLYISLYM